MAPCHIVLSCKANWSHLRSMCILSARIAHSRAIHVTILVSSLGNVVERVTQEVSRCTNVEEMNSSSKVRVVGLSTDSTDNGATDRSFKLIWRALMNGEAITCSYTLQHVEAVPPPLAVVLDGFQLSWLEIIRSEPSSPPIFQWMMAFSGGFMYMCGPTNSKAGSAKSMEQNMHDCDESILIPGMLPMTCRNLNPQDVGDKAIKIQIAETIMTQFAQKADGLLTACAPEYDSVECLDAISEWIACQRGRKTFHIGPMLPLIPGTTTFSAKAIEVEINTCPDGSGIAVTRFLDQCMSSHGRHSVFYISFGTEHWPSSLDHLEILLDAMIARKHPFLLAHKCADAQTISELKTKYLGHEEALILPFVPQQTVLAHEACGWFITHGGANGVMEALTQGIPMIGWPFAIDQPLNIAHMAQTLDAGFEFTHMRANYCPVKGSRSEDSPPDMGAWEKEVGDVLAAAATTVGERKRRNAVRIGKDLGKAWAGDGGRARLQLERFLDTLGV